MKMFSLFVLALTVASCATSEPQSTQTAEPAQSAEVSPEGAHTSAQTSADSETSVNTTTPASSEADGDFWDCSNALEVVSLEVKDPNAEEPLYERVPNPDGEGQPGRVHWRGDLNGDDATDLIVNHRDCGNWGDCIFGVYAGCADGRFAVLYHDYAQEWRVGKATTTIDGRAWKNLTYVDRDTTADPSKQEITDVRKFNGKTY